MIGEPPANRRIGVLDIGSNSVRFVVYEIFGSAFTAIYNEKVLAGLGRDLRETGRLSVAGRETALAAIRRFRTIADAHQLQHTIIGATAAMREASDASKFIQVVETETGWDVSPLSGLEEARFTAFGVIAAEPRSSGIAADLGGASLELIHVDSGTVQSGQSYPVGPFQIVGQNLGQLDTWDVDTIRQSIRDQLDPDSLPRADGKPLYLVGGAWRNLAGVHQQRHLYPLKTVQAYELMPGAARDLARWASNDGREDLLNWPGISTRRCETLPFSALLLDILLDLYTPPKVIFSSTGLREGLVYNRLSDPLKTRDALLDGCRDLARGNLQGLHFADPLFSFLQPIDGDNIPPFAPDAEGRLRRAATHLVGIGKGLHPDYRADLVFEDVLYAPLSGLTHQERAYLALVLFHSFTNKMRTPNDAAIKLLLSLSQRNRAHIFGTAIRLAVVASGRSPHLLEHFTLSTDQDCLTLTVAPEKSVLFTERVAYRLQKLGQVMNLKTAVVGA